jgi:NAD(P)-dependent dehydrogenase (short-subunit alcohol dehydrogenase family)
MVKELHSESDRKLWLRYLPLRRYGTPEEIAMAIEFLLDGTRSAYITGEVLGVDGGFRGTGIMLD